jgi:prevent-host-death family protein
MAVWQVQQAKARFSELLDRAERDGPQTISRHGTERAVVLSIADYHRMKSTAPDLAAHLLGGPRDDTFDAVRDSDVGREIAL